VAQHLGGRTKVAETAAYGRKIPKKHKERKIIQNLRKKKKKKSRRSIVVNFNYLLFFKRIS
jgi:hypothetical protein